MVELLSNPEFWKYASIPFVAALVGWSTNWVAIQLTFYPLTFWGIPPYLGWQGVIPSKAEKMARISVDKSLSKIGTLHEIFEEMDPETLSRHIAESIEPWVAWYSKDVLFAAYPKLFKVLPDALKQRVFDQVKERLPDVVDEIIGDIHENIYDVLDLTEMVVQELSDRPELLVRIFLECGEEEFKFIVKSGIYLGFVFGLIQMSVWYFYPKAWVLPAFGVLVGLATNWIALTAIFKPLRPVKVGPWTLQGLFLKRQKEASRIWCSIVTKEIVTLENLTNSMFNGPNEEVTRDLISNRVEEMVEEATLANAGAFRDMIIGPERLARMKDDTSAKVVSLTSVAFHDDAFAEGRQEVVEEMMYERMIELTPEEFQDMLRPAFKEDEWKLIVAGGVLGALAGVVQFVLVFAT